MYLNDSIMSVRTLSRTGAPARAIPAARRRRGACVTWGLSHAMLSWPLHMAMAWRSVTLIHDMHQRPRSTVRGARTQWAFPGALSTQQPQASEDPMDKPLAGRRMHAHRRLHAREIVLHGKAKQPERHYDEDQAQIVHEVEPD